MAIDVQELQTRIASTVDQSASAADVGSSKWNLRLKNLNRSQNDWEETYTWRENYKEYLTATSTSTGNASVNMLSDFRRPAKFLNENDARNNAWDSSVLMGNPAVGYVAFVNPGTTNGFLASGASLIFPYYAAPASLTTATDVSMCPNPEFLVKRAIYYEWNAIEDPRFPQAFTDSEKELLKMLERENTQTGVDLNNRVRTDIEKRNFRPGRD